jgi:hypothetical protein
MKLDEDNTISEPDTLSISTPFGVVPELVSIYWLKIIED